MGREEDQYMETCWNCGGEGYSHHDCGEDCCMCFRPEDNVVCDICNGHGEYPVDPDDEHDPYDDLRDSGGIVNAVISGLEHMRDHLEAGKPIEDLPGYHERHAGDAATAAGAKPGKDTP